MGLADEVRDALLELESDLPGNTFAYAAGEVTGEGACIPTMLNAGLQLQLGGKLATVRRTIFIRCDLFSAPPVAKKPITINGTEHRIADVKRGPNESHYEIQITGINEL